MHFRPLNHRRAAHAAKRTRLRKQAGFNMVELGLVLVIITLALVGIIMYFSTNSVASQSQSLAANLTTIAGNVKQSYQGNYANVSNTALNSGGFFKKLASINATGATPTVTLGGGTLTVAPGTVNTANDSAQYTITQLPDDSCIPLISSMSKSVAYLSIAPNGGTASVVKAVGASADPSKISCSNDNNTLVYKVL
ncbi:hypothetical protein JYK21_01610 [Ralstonia pickettii]|nr:hypothetical protein [Ralstonia pickettii]